MKINWNYIKAFVLAALVVFLFGFSHKKNSTQKVKDIVIEFEEGSNLFMSNEMVNKLLIQNGESVKNKAKTVIDLHKFESNVLSHEMVENAAVFLTVDGVLKTKVKQRTPIARILSENDSYYIDRQAKKMPLSENHSARVMLVSGKVTKKISAEVYKLVSAILNDDFLKKQIVGVEIMPDNEFALRTRVGEQQILIGRIDDLREKFENLKSFYNKTMTDNSIDNYTTINLKYNNQVVCTKK